MDRVVSHVLFGTQHSVIILVMQTLCCLTGILSHHADIFFHIWHANTLWMPDFNCCLMHISWIWLSTQGMSVIWHSIIRVCHCLGTLELWNFPVLMWHKMYVHVFSKRISYCISLFLYKVYVFTVSHISGCIYTCAWFHCQLRHQFLYVVSHL